ncbi:hypothetical protein HK101_009766 [Irineochytrium annulatum]|nr:hypothetical protein HK101_009766 [Irineochytrium annulatum]
MADTLERVQLFKNVPTALARVPTDIDAFAEGFAKRGDDTGRAAADSGCGTSGSGHLRSPSDERERSWLLEHYIPGVVSQLKKLVQEGLGSCCSSVDLGKLLDHKGVINTSASQDMVKGFVTVDGSNIVKGVRFFARPERMPIDEVWFVQELTLKLPHYSRGVGKVAIVPARPYKLMQLQTVRNHLAAALNVLENYETVKSNFGEVAHV